VDSCPVVLAKGTRSGHAKVACELCEKSYNSSRKEWYYGLKLHAIVARRPGRLPVPLSPMASGAASHSPVAKRILEDNLFLNHGQLHVDKAYVDADWAERLKKDHTIVLLTPRKKRKEDTLTSGDTFSLLSALFVGLLSAFSIGSIASPIFNPPRSLSDLRLHIFARIAAALVALLFNS